MELPEFTPEGLLPAGDYCLTFDELKASCLVGKGTGTSATWDTEWREMLVENLEILVRQLWSVGIDDIFIDGSFVEDKDHPSDIDGYFHCEPLRFATGQLAAELNALDTHRIWTWDQGRRRYDKDTHKKQLPMWHQYLVELYPHFPGVMSGISDEFGNSQEFPAAFRKCRRRLTSDGRLAMIPKGIIKIIKSN